MRHCTTMFLVLCLVGCGPAPVPTKLCPAPERLALPGLKNSYRLGEKLFSGATPEGAEAFAALAELGVTTVISVDSQTPNIELAARHGLAYIHLPVEYSGIANERAGQVIAAYTSATGGVYLHCHHGKHRGPAACAILLRATEPGWTAAAARAWMETAGTDPAYRGLYDSMAKAGPHLKITENPSDIPPTDVQPLPLATRMVEVDELWTRLQQLEGQRWVDRIEAVSITALLREQYLEAARLNHAAYSPTLLAEFPKSAGRVTLLRAALEAGDAARSAEALVQIKADCRNCHETHRNFVLRQPR